MKLFGRQVVVGGRIGRRVAVPVRLAGPNRVDRDLGRVGVDRLDRLRRAR